MDAKDFDNNLRANLALNHEMIRILDECRDYDSASTTNWLIQRLLLIKELIINKSIILIASGSISKLESISDFKYWVKNNYALVYEDIFKK